jgi:O-antigen ligase
VSIFSISQPSFWEKSLLALAGLLLVYPAWVRGGTYVPIQPPLVWIGLLILLCLIMAARRGAREWRSSFLLKDPIFYIGAVFLLLLVIQWLNAGRQLVFDSTQSKWLYTPPPIPWLPSAITKAEAGEMLAWFFPAWTLLLTLRSGLFGRRTLRYVYGLLAGNAALLALFGIVQFISGTQSIYWIQPLDCPFFASFGYANHAGAFFTLMFAISAGLLSRRFVTKQFGGRARWLVMLSVCALLNFLAANLSLSRAAILLTWTLAAFLVLYTLLKTWPILRPVQRLNLLAAIAATALVAGLLVAATAKDDIEEELSTLHPGSRSANLLGGEWALLRPAAFKMWQDHPVTGVGGWGFRYLLGWYIPPEQWREIRVGDASVHNDALQFLAEFGAVGAGLMAATVLVLLVPALKNRPWKKPLPLLALLGLGATASHSMIDLPFRSPAILYSWLAILAVLPAMASTELPYRNIKNRVEP